MSVFHENMLIGSSGQGAPAAAGISRSLRFNSADSASLSRTPASAGNRKTWTWAGWVKRSASLNSLFRAGTSFSSNPVFTAVGADGDKIVINQYDYPTATWGIDSVAVFRDYSAWYHIVIAVDTTQATSANRVKLYVNNVLQSVTQRSGYSSAYPSQNSDTWVNAANAHEIGSGFSGYLADIYFIDGQALDPTSFTETDATTGQLIPKAYTGSYGTNGFHLEFADNSSNTATTLGKDTSGNSPANNWTPNNLSVTAGAGNDSLVDSPSNGTASSGGDAGGVVTGNYATLNPIATSGEGRATLANGNLDISGSGSNYTGNVSTIAVASGKWYWEYTITTLGTRNGSGIIAADSLAAANGATYGFASSSNAWMRQTTGGGSGVVANNSSDVVTGLSGFTANDVCIVAVDIDAGKLWFGKNGTWDSSGNPATGANPTITFTPGGKSFYACVDAYNTWAGVINFGARAFSYTAPSGFKALCTANLPAPLVTKPSTVMDVKLYSGNGSTQTISGLGFEPDLVWLKGRSVAYSHQLYDQVRGAGKLLGSNTTNAESTVTDNLTAFTSTGFSLGSDAGTNQSSATYAAWAWDAGSSTVTNTQGSITSSVRANATAGFSVVTFTKSNGSSNAATIGHGLNATPYLIITKTRNLTEPWYTYHNALGNNGRVQLNETSAATIGTSVWGTTSPTSQVFTMQGVLDANYVAYCFAPVVGYSSFGSYTGNGSSDGPFVYTGFRPRWLLIKCSSVAGESWFVLDSARSAYNVTQDYLVPNSSASESSAYNIVDFLSNGFKLKTSAAGSAFNGSGATYVYAAFAESPFNYARAR